MSNFSCNAILIIIAVIVIITVIYYITSNRGPIHNDGTVSLNNENNDKVIGNLISKYSDHPNDYVSPSDPMEKKYAPVSGYQQKRRNHMRNMEEPCDESETDDRDFIYKKKKYTKRSEDDIKDLFNVDKMLPQEKEDWFDTQPLQGAKKIKGNHLINPISHINVNTIGSSLRNASHDPRGDIINPKRVVSPWNNSTIEPDTNMKNIYC